MSRTPRCRSLSTGLPSFSLAIALHAVAFLLPGAKTAPMASMREGTPGELALELVAAPVEPSETAADQQLPQLGPPSLTMVQPEQMVPSLPVTEQPEPDETLAEPVPPAKKSPNPGPQPDRKAHSPVPSRHVAAVRSSGLAQTSAAPDYLRNPPPSYPSASRKAGEEGTVLLLVSVTEEGRVARVNLRRGSGYNRLDEAAVRSVNRWRFKPAHVNGRRVAAEVEVPITFKLN